MQFYRQLKASWNPWAFFLKDDSWQLVGEEPWTVLAVEEATSQKDLLRFGGHRHRVP